MTATVDATPRLHPAAEWARETEFDTTAVDCTTTVVLKILDNKCKMLPGEKAAIMAIYDVIKQQPSELFDADALRIIEQARQEPGKVVLQNIHHLRIYGEEHIPKPVMKRYKAMLRDGLFG
jgi:hypothetical protein